MALGRENDNYVFQLWEVAYRAGSRHALVIVKDARNQPRDFLVTTHRLHSFRRCSFQLHMWLLLATTVITTSLHITSTINENFGDGTIFFFLKCFTTCCFSCTQFSPIFYSPFLSILIMFCRPNINAIHTLTLTVFLHCSINILVLKMWSVELLPSIKSLKFISTKHLGFFLYFCFISSTSLYSFHLYTVVSIQSHDTRLGSISVLFTHFLLQLQESYHISLSVWLSCSPHSWSCSHRYIYITRIISTYIPFANIIFLPPDIQ